MGLPKVPFTMFDDGRVLGQIAQDVRLDPVLVLFPPTHRAFSRGPTVGSLFDCVLADGVGDHLGGLFIGGGEVDFVTEV